MSASCERPATPNATDSTPSASAPFASAPSVTSVPRAPAQKPLAGELIDVPGGAFHAGSVPGEEGRDPELEPRRYEVELGPYRIDRLPYPNDPGQPPTVNVSRDEAKRLCAKRAARLCTELEWERACRGPESDRFATGDSWHPECAAEPYNCASGFDVLGMGAALREWVDSDVRFTNRGRDPMAAVRGAAKTEAPALHRCATRRAIDHDKKAGDLGFRCCKGPPNAAVVAEPKLGDTFRKQRLTAKRLTELLGQDEVTQPLAKDVKLFREPEAANTVVARGPGDKKGFSFTVSPMLWNPSTGTEYLVASGRSGEDKSFVVVFHVLGKDAYRLATSFIMQGEPGPVAFAYSDYIRPRFHFSTCWGCPGETGKILFREPDSAIILQP